MSEPTDGGAPPHRRRPRYRGTHPRGFADKYKEHAPDRYPELIAHLRARGRTPAGQHVPILVDEVVQALQLRPGMRGVDATLGWGGHAERFLEVLSGDGQLLALDVDPIELPRTEARLRGLGYGEDRLLVQRGNFAGVQAAILRCGWPEGVDFLFADLGVSSMQIDNPGRGFSFKTDGPLDLRLNPNRGLSGAAWLQRAAAEKIVRVLRDNADEPHADAIGAALDVRRGAVTTTQELAAVVRAALEPLTAADEIDLSVRRTFQAIRVEVNDEFGALDALLRQLPGCLKPGGRTAVLTFHSGEDRRVKQAFAAGLRDGTFDLSPREVVRPGAAEQHANSRAKSAKLRWARRAVRSSFRPSPTPRG